LIDDHGRILSLLPAKRSGILTGSIVPRRPLTFFTKHGYWMITGSLLLFLMMLLTNKR
jgi:apolipoprotein N-acyltransferase